MFYASINYIFAQLSFYIILRPTGIYVTDDPGLSFVVKIKMSRYPKLDKAYSDFEDFVSCIKLIFKMIVLTNLGPKSVDLIFNAPNVANLGF